MSGYPLYAITRSSGPVILRTYPTEQARNHAYHVERKRLQDGGYDTDEVKDIATGPPEPGTVKAEKADPMTAALIQGMLNL